MIREWGWIGTAGRRKIELHDSDGSAMEALEMWLRRKQRRATSSVLSEDKALPGGLHRIQSAPSPGANLPP
ncbi:WGR domain-containing protein [Microvirga sp.]|uniref:WGR domain-containing protein n=1 Tax=Microvirga sp. TaxID=1873136 RepID=UPI001FED6198|nr:WGR domain-containing protein [Microvirga sp.]